MNARAADFAAVLLAGGKSARMGRDKAALVIDGLPLWQLQLAKLRALDPAELLISGPLDGPWAGAEVEVIPDLHSGVGPLGGLATVLSRMRCQRLLVLAVDLASMTADFLRTLLGPRPGDRGLVPKLDNAFEPLAAIYPRAMHSIATRCLASEDFSLQRWVRLGIEEGLLDIRPVEEGERAFFRNLNAPADLQRLDAAAPELRCPAADRPPAPPPRTPCSSAAASADRRRGR